MAVQISSVLHVFAHLFRFSHQRLDPPGHGATQEAPAAVELHPGESGRRGDDHGVIRLHHHHHIGGQRLLHSRTHWMRR